MKRRKYALVASRALYLGGVSTLCALVLAGCSSSPSKSLDIRKPASVPTTSVATVTTLTAPSTTTTVPPPTTTTSRPPPPSTTTQPPPTTAPVSAAPASCTPISDEGTCYEPGEYCRDDDHGASGVAGDGERITCEDNDGWRWEPT